MVGASRERMKITRSSIALLAMLLAPVVARSQPSISSTPPGAFLTLAQLRAEYANPAGHIARIYGVDVYYVDQGHGPAILMIHGSASSLHTWDGVAAKLVDHYRVIRYDVPGQGLSGPISDAAAAQVKPADIAAGLLERLGVRQATVVGVSSGGTLAVQLAAAYPDLVNRVVLSNAPSDPVVTTHLQQPPTFVALQAQARATHFQSRAFWNAFLDFFSGDPARISPAVRRQYYDMNRRVPEPNALSLVAKVADHPAAVAAMAAVRGPVLLIWGGADPLLPVAAAHTLAGYLTGAQVSLIILPDVGHYPPLEVPARFAMLLRAYIEAATPQAALSDRAGMLIVAMA